MVAAAPALLALLALPGMNSDDMLHGPVSVLHDNQLGFRAGMAKTNGGFPMAPKLFADYGFHLGGSEWLHLGIAGQSTDCGGLDPPCTSFRLAELTAAVAWRIPTDIPLVYFGKLGGGLLYHFPSGDVASVGLGVRGGGGLEYWFFDWLAATAEIGATYGGFLGGTLSSAYVTLDFSLGPQVRF